METAVARSCTPHLFAETSAAASGQARRALERVLDLSRSTTFGNVAIVLFFVSQALDGAFTYIGVLTWGPTIEGNPLLAWLMAAVGPGTALASAKLAAAGFGMILHLAAVHRAVAILTAIYVSAALFPWMLLFVVIGHMN
jgi:Domain of unknown function (DUF5658)